VHARGNNIGAGERNRETRHPPRTPNLLGRIGHKEKLSLDFNPRFSANPWLIIPLNRRNGK
jgi:hypothetical protein